MNGSKAKFLRRVAGGIPLPPVVKPVGRIKALLVLVGHSIPGPTRRAARRFIVSREQLRMMRERELRKKVYRYIKDKAKKEKVT